MELLRLAIRYYMKVTGKSCSEFFQNLQSVYNTDIHDQSGDAWLRHKLVEQVINHGSDIDTIVSNKDSMISYFGVKYDSEIQEYSAEPVWGKEVFKLLTTSGIDIDNTVFWDIHCLSDSLFPTKIQSKNVFLSHYNEAVINNLVTKKGTPFIYDFIQSENILSLPATLKEAIEHDKPLVILCCIPIKKDNIKNTISDRMYSDGFTTHYEDIHYQYLYKIMNFVQQYNLTNCYVGFFGDTSLFTSESNIVFYQKFREVLNFKNGFCFSLRDFNSTLLNVNSLHFSLWKTEPNFEVPILLIKKRLVSKTKVEDGEQILFGSNRSSLLEWLQPTDTLFYKQAPVMLNYATFKGGEKFEKTIHSMGQIAENALGTMAISEDAKNLSRTVLLSGVPSVNKGMTYVSITEENFWRCVATFAYSQLETITWGNKELKLSAPNILVEGYDEWCKNAILMFLLDKKSMFSNLRNLKYNKETYTVDNHMFFVDKELVQMSTSDNLIKQQMKYSVSNEFVMSKIAEARRSWKMETIHLYEFCIDFVQRTMDKRKEVRYIEDTDSWNAGFSQLVSVFGETDLVFKANFYKLYNTYIEMLSKEKSKFGFIQDR